MESLCKIELRGIVGTASVTVVGDKNTITFSLATEYCLAVHSIQSQPELQLNTKLPSPLNVFHILRCGIFIFNKKYS